MGTTDDVKEDDTSSSPQPVPKNKKKIESLTNGKVKSEGPPVADKTKMVSEKPVSDNENNGEKAKKKKKLKKIKTTEIEKNEVAEPIARIKKEKSKNLSPKQV